MLLNSQLIRSRRKLFRTRQTPINGLKKQRLFLPAQKAVGQEPAHRLVVEFQTEISQYHRSRDERQGAGQGLREGEVFVLDPGIIEVDERVVHHVQRVRNVPQKFADPGRHPVRRLSRSPETDEQRKEDYGAQGVVQPVHPQMFASPDARHGQQRHDRQGADPERAPNPHGLEHTRKQQSGRESEQQAQRAAEHVVPVHGEPDADVAEGSPDGERRQPAAGEQHQHGKRPGRKLTDEESVEDIADILEKQRPARAVERIHFTQPPDFGTGRRRNQQRVQQRGRQQHGYGHRRDIPDGTALKIEHDGPDHGPHDDHRMQTDQPPLEKILYRHLFLPAVVVGVTDDETRKYEEKIDGQIAVVDPLVEMAGRIGFEQMEPDDRDRRYAAQSVEYVVVRFGVCKCS